MAAKEYLIRYGYELQADGRYRQPGRRTQVWEPTEGGWLRFEIGADGREVPEVYRVAESHQGIGGLDKVNHPEAFEWVYPEAEVLKIYKDALEDREVKLVERAARLRKQAEGENPDG